MSTLPPTQTFLGDHVVRHHFVLGQGSCCHYSSFHPGNMNKNASRGLRVMYQHPVYWEGKTGEKG